jgi:hypothetical protein
LKNNSAGYSVSFWFSLRISISAHIAHQSDMSSTSSLDLLALYSQFFLVLFLFVYLLI